MNSHLRICWTRQDGIGRKMSDTIKSLIRPVMGLNPEGTVDVMIGAEGPKVDMESGLRR